MIESIDLPDSFPFSGGKQQLEHLKPVCYIFGGNGTGKTTISRLIKNDSDKLDADSRPCSIHLTGPLNTRIYVYNRDFMAENFSASLDVPGVFTLGKDSIQIQNNIKTLNDELGKHREKQAAAQINLTEAEQSLEAKLSQIIEAAWGIKSTVPPILIKDLPLSRGDKKKYWLRLKDYLDSEIQTEPLPDTSELEQRANLLFDKEAIILPVPNSPDTTNFFKAEADPIFSKKIAGKEDSTIAPLLEKLQNSDWVERGRQYIDGNTCPFCQQETISSIFQEALDEFFDETYEQDRIKLQSAYNRYLSERRELISSIQQIVDSYSSEFNTNALQDLLSRFTLLTENNLEEMKRKMEELDYLPLIESSEEICFELNKLSSSIIKEINDRNTILNERTNEIKQLQNEIWIYLSQITRDTITPLINEGDKLEQRILGLNERIKSLSNIIKEKEDDIRILEQQVTNIHETAATINNLLERCGFTSFHLTTVDDRQSYRIARKDGSLAKDTLSEGEANFLSFLYFYQLCSGSLEPSGTTEDRIIVIDDPISSLDSNILFTVSSLVRQLTTSAREHDTKIQQVIILTHNITFHREITYIRKGEGDADTAYFTIHKNHSGSTIEQFSTNPINSTYELLWKDLFRDDCLPITAQNLSRRIIETFFKFIGSVDIDKLISNMETPDKEIAQSFLSWANAGSHSPIDDETFFNTCETTETFKRILHSIFTNSGHSEHYDRMIEICTSLPTK